jgi:hypothetical protein
MGQTVCVRTQRDFAHQALVHDSSEVLRCRLSVHLDEALSRGHAVVLAGGLRIGSWCVDGELCVKADASGAVPTTAPAGCEAPHDLSRRSRDLHIARWLADVTARTSAEATPVLLIFPLGARTGMTGEG